MKAEKIYSGLFRYFMNTGDRFDSVYYHDGFESDFLRVSKSGYVTEVEVKVSRSDYMADFRKSRDFCPFDRETRTWGKRTHVNKHEQIKQGFTGLKYFYFCVPEGLLCPEDVPEYCGLLVCSESGRIREKKKAPTLINANKIEDKKKRKMIFNLYCRYIEFKRKFYEKKGV